MGEETITLNVTRVIGTGDPLDGIMLIPLIVDWKVPQNCAYGVFGSGEECEAALRRLYVLEEPLQGHKVIGVCEVHHQKLSGDG